MRDAHLLAVVAMRRTSRLKPSTAFGCEDVGEAGGRSRRCTTSIMVHTRAGNPSERFNTKRAAVGQYSEVAR